MKVRLMSGGVRLLTLSALGVIAWTWIARAEGPPFPPFEASQQDPSFDWIQMSSGEWLKGEFKQVYDDTLYFDSDEFDDVSPDFADVNSLVTPRTVRVRLPERRIVQGTMRMQDKVVEIDTGTQVVRVDSSEIVGIEVGEQREINYWSASASIGFSIRQGNTEQSDLNVRGNIKRQTSLTRTQLSYTGNLSSSNPNPGDPASESVGTANNHRVPASFDLFLTDRLFIQPVGFEYYTAEFKNVDNRYTIGGGLGYELYSSSWVDLEIGGGAAYQNTDFRTGDPADEDNAAVTINFTFDFDLPRGIEWDNRYDGQITVTNMDRTSTHLESILSFDVWGPLEFEATFLFDRIERPVQPGDGIVIQPNDFNVTFGLSIDL